MTGQLSIYGAQALLGALFGQTITPPANFFVALCTAPPSISMNGNEISEPDVSLGYVRATIPNAPGDGWWDVEQGWLAANTGVLTWPPVNSTYPNGAPSDWPQTDYWALLDAPTGGNVYAIGQLTYPVQVSAGSVASCAIGALSIELGPFFRIATS